MKNIQSILLYSVLLLFLGACADKQEDILDSSPLSIDSLKSGAVYENLRIDAGNFDYGIKLENVENVTIRNVTVIGSVEAGILVRGCKNISIVNCTVENSGKSGIRLSNESACDGVYIESCTIRNSFHDAIIVAANDSRSEQHTNVVIRGNTISVAGTDLSWPGHYHGLYVQVPDCTIENNRVVDVIDGSGISLRASATVSGNTIIRTGKHGISYFPDHHTYDSRTLVVEGNKVWDIGNNGELSSVHALVVLNPPDGMSFSKINSVVFRNNQLPAKKDDAQDPDIDFPSPNYLTGSNIIENNMIISSEPK